MGTERQRERNDGMGGRVLHSVVEWSGVDIVGDLGVRSKIAREKKGIRPAPGGEKACQGA